METEKRNVLLALTGAAIIAIVLTVVNWKSSTDVLKMPKDVVEMPKESHREVDRATFFAELLKEIKTPAHIGRILVKDEGTVSVDSLLIVRKWALEAGLQPLESYIDGEIANQKPTEENLTSAARNMIFSAAKYKDYPGISDFLFQRGKKLIDLGLKINNKNIPLRNALITYISEYENEPMKFLGVLRETLAMDSNNVETHFIHLNLLKKSGQWKKAIQKCQKLVSLQPQNSAWLFEASDIYGTMGDSVNAKVYLNLAIKTKKTSNSTH